MLRWHTWLSMGSFTLSSQRTQTCCHMDVPGYVYACWVPMLEPCSHVRRHDVYTLIHLTIIAGVNRPRKQASAMHACTDIVQLSCLPCNQHCAHKAAQVQLAVCRWHDKQKLSEQGALCRSCSRWTRQGKGRRSWLLICHKTEIPASLALLTRCF